MVQLQLRRPKRTDGLPAAVTTERAIERPVYLVPEAKRHSTNGAGHPYDVVQAAWRIRTAERNRQLDEIEYVVTRIVPTRRKNVDDADIGCRRGLWFTTAALNLVVSVRRAIVGRYF